MKNEIMEWIKTIVLSVVIALVITTFIKPTIVRQHSMSPTLEEYDFLIINRLLYKRSTPNYGDIIVFKSDLKTNIGNNKLLIKRVIALPSDELFIEEGRIYLNGQLLEEEYLNGIETDGKDVEGERLIVPEGKLFVMGDNRGNSMDSRDRVIGFINQEDIVGKAFIRLFPFNKIGRL